MLYLIQRSNLYIDTPDVRMPLLQSSEAYMRTFMGEDIQVDPDMHAKYDKEFYCTTGAVSDVLDAMWNKYLLKVCFWYCPVCEIMQAYYNQPPVSEVCCVKTKEVQKDIGLKFFELTRLMNTKTALLHIPREELMVHLL